MLFEHVSLHPLNCCWQLNHFRIRYLQSLFGRTFQLRNLLQILPDSYRTNGPRKFVLAFQFVSNSDEASLERISDIGRPTLWNPKRKPKTSELRIAGHNRQLLL